MNPRYRANSLNVRDATSESDALYDDVAPGATFGLNADTQPYDKQKRRFSRAGRPVSLTYDNPDLSAIDEQPTSPLYSPTLPVLAYEAKNMVDTKNLKRLNALHSEAQSNRWSSGDYADAANDSGGRRILPMADY